MQKKPKYLDIAESLDRQIAGMGANSLLHTEQQLAKRFKVSRVTVRRALGFLQRCGLLSRERGRGTIVNPPKILRQLVPVCTIEDDVRQQGLKLETRLVEFRPEVIPSGDIRERLRLGPHETAARLSLTRMVDERIISHDQRYVRSNLASAFDPSLVTLRSIPSILQEITGQAITSVRWESQITAAPYEVAKELGIVPGLLIFVTNFVHYLESGAPAEAGVAYYRIDRVKFHAAASGPALAMSLSGERQDL